MLVKKQKIRQVIGLGFITLMGAMPLTLWAQTSDNAIQNNSACIDPFEKMNRTIYKFNRALDRGTIRSIAYGYYSYTPKELQIGVHNFFENLTQPITIANDILQCKIGYAAHDTSRFVINSTFGIFGFFEVASLFGLEPRKEDFGQTMEKWGYKKSIYVMLPIFGPSTLRDTIGFVVDSLYFDPIAYIRPVAWQYGLSAGRRLDQRVALLPGEKLLENIGVDEYLFIRNFYFQKRALAFKDDGLQIDLMQTGGSTSRALEQELDTQDPFAEPGFDTDTSGATEPAASNLDIIELAQADSSTENFNVKTRKVPEFRKGSRVFKIEDPKAIAAPKVEPTKVEPMQVDAPKVDADKIEAEKLNSAPELQAPRLDPAPKAQAVKIEAPKIEAPKVEAPKLKTPKADVPPKIDAHKAGVLNSKQPNNLNTFQVASTETKVIETQVIEGQAPKGADLKISDQSPDQIPDNSSADNSSVILNNTNTGKPKPIKPFFIKEVLESTS